MSLALQTRIRETLRDVPNFPNPGVLFKDITPVLGDGELFQEITRHLAERYAGQVEQIVGIESRGFIFGAALANELGIGLTLVRKPGKLPAKTIGVDYTLEYGTDRLEMHVDALHPSQPVVIIDDLLATGGTAVAALELVSSTGAHIVEIGFLIELAFLAGRERLGDHRIHSLVTF
jgi:adenine phosphoribosyltransferase